MVEADAKQRWATAMIAFLVAAIDAAGQTRVQGLPTLLAPELKRYHIHCDAFRCAAQAVSSHSSQRTGKRGRIKQSPAYNLIERLREHRDDTLRFSCDLRVPFDYNQDECDVRMPKLKLKQKVCGCSRAESGAAVFATIRSFLSTPHKRFADLFDVLVLSVQGSPPMLRLEYLEG